MRIPVPFRKVIHSKKDAKATMGFLSRFEENIPGHFPGLESFKEEKGSYRWTFEKVSYSGYDFQIQLLTKLTPSGRKIRIESIPEKGATDIRGEWEVMEAGSEADIRFEVLLELELPVPFFMKSIATSLTQKELSTFFERYMNNVEKSLSV